MKIKILVFLAVLGLVAAGLIFFAEKINEPTLLVDRPVKSSINEADDFIRVDQPVAGELIGSPLIIRGEARGTWYFEASFPVSLVDETGQEVAQGVAQAQGDWMTEEFVPFEAILKFDQPIAPSGDLILKRDNPSGQPEGEAQVIVPVKFKL